MRRLGSRRDVGQVIDGNRPCNQPRLRKSSKLREQKARGPGLLWVDRDDF